MHTTEILSATIVGAAGAGTDAGMVEVDMSSLSLDREFLLVGKTVGNTTAPGSAKTVTLNYYFSDEKIDSFASAAATILADRKVSSSAKTLTNSASITQMWAFTGIIRPLGRWMYVSFDNDDTDADSSVAITVSVSRVPSTAKDF